MTMPAGSSLGHFADKRSKTFCRNYYVSLTSNGS